MYVDLYVHCSRDKGLIVPGKPINTLTHRAGVYVWFPQGSKSRKPLVAPIKPCLFAVPHPLESEPVFVLSRCKFLINYSLPTNEGICIMTIWTLHKSIWQFVWKLQCYTLIQEFCFHKLSLMVDKVLNSYIDLYMERKALKSL